MGCVNNLFVRVEVAFMYFYIENKGYYRGGLIYNPPTFLHTRTLFNQINLEAQSKKIA